QADEVPYRCPLPPSSPSASASRSAVERTSTIPILMLFEPKSWLPTGTTSRFAPAATPSASSWKHSRSFPALQHRFPRSPWKKTTSTSQTLAARICAFPRTSRTICATCI
ncbi:hypothetical protein PENTCL1PPCAC_30730, partial [Pristionchus entomophagus]